MTALPIDPGTPIIPPAEPPLMAMLDYGVTHNPTQNALFQRYGPLGLVREYIDPWRAAELGSMVLVRMIPEVDWDWLACWQDACDNLDYGPTLYCRPNELSNNNVEYIRYYWHSPIACEGWGLGPNGAALWSLGLQLVASEPAADRAAPDYIKVRGLPCIVSDQEWYNGVRQPNGWHSFQVPPWDQPGGCWRWFQIDALFPGQPLIEQLRSWLALTAQPWVRRRIIPADYAAQIVAARRMTP